MQQAKYSIKFGEDMGLWINSYLWNDGDVSPEVMEPNVHDIDLVNSYGAKWLCHSEEDR